MVDEQVTSEEQQAESEPGEINPSLKSILGDLRKISLIFNNTTPIFQEPVELKALNKTLSDRYGRVPKRKMDAQSLLALSEKWERTKNSREFDSLTRREFIMLCSLPDATKDEAYLELLEAWNEKIPFRALPVLLATIHETWGENPNQKSLCYAFSRLLKGYLGNRSYLQAWSKNSNMYLSQEGIKEFAWLLSTEHYDISTLCSHYHLPSSSSTFVNLIRKQAIENLINEIKKTSQYDYAIWTYLFEDLIDTRDYQQLSELILVSDKYTKQGSQEAEEFLKQWFLDPVHFGDPRIYPGNWELKISQQARDTFIQWLSKEDLAFFFNLLLRKGEDEHGRRAFWEQYLCHVVSSRVFISDGDLARNRHVIQDMRNENKTLPARIEENTSAFMMLTRDLIIIEFSEKGNAAYIWHRNDIPKTLEYDLTRLYERNCIFSKKRMINSQLPTLTANNYQLESTSIRFSHIPNPGWQMKPKIWLDAQHIRPC